MTEDKLIEQIKRDSWGMIDDEEAPDWAVELCRLALNTIESILRKLPERSEWPYDESLLS